MTAELTKPNTSNINPAKVAAIAAGSLITASAVFMTSIEVTPGIASTQTKTSSIATATSTQNNQPKFHPDNVYIQKEKTSVIPNLPNINFSFGGDVADARSGSKPKPKPNTNANGKKRSETDYGKGANRVLKGLEGASYVIDGYDFFKSFSGNDKFIVANEYTLEWQEVSKMCDKVNGQLIWRNGLKTCI